MKIEQAIKNLEKFAKYYEGTEEGKIYKEALEELKKILNKKA